MPIRITGLNSGLDTESIISALVSAYSYKTSKYKKAQTKLGWKQDAWKALNTKIYSFYTNVGNMKLSTAYNMKTATASDTTKAKVSASSTAVNGSYSIQVTQLAKTGYLTGAQLGNSVGTKTKMSELGFSGTGTITVGTGSSSKDITVNGNTTISDFVTSLQDAGVRASYDATNRRIYVSAKESGEANDFTLMGADAKGNAAIEKLGLSVALDEHSAEYRQYQELASYSGYTADEIKAFAQAKKDAAANNTALQLEITGLNNKNTYQQNAMDYANAAMMINNVGRAYTGAGDSAKEFTLLKTLASRDSLEDTYVDEDGDIYTKDSTTGKYTTLKQITNADGETTYETVERVDMGGLPTGAEKLDSLCREFGLVTTTTTPGVDGGEDVTTTNSDGLETFRTNLSTVVRIAHDAEISGTPEYQDLLTEANTAANSTTDTEAFLSAREAQVTANNAEIETKNTAIAANNATIADKPYITTDMLTDDAKVTDLMNKAAYAQSVIDGGTSAISASGATRINGQDATIYVNGAEYKGDSNNFSINGLIINATAVTGSAFDPTETNAFNVTVNTDSQGIYDKIKDMLTQYNTLINEITSLYNASTAKGYEPLTDEEKDAMSDTEVEKWEEKIKASLLRRDDSLESIMNGMTAAMQKGYTIGGKSYNLSTFGISTLGFLNAAENEQNAFHINGDEDDSATSGKEDKLMAAINSDPDTVVSFMQQLCDGLYSNIDARMKSSTISSVYKVYNDKEMASEYSDYTTLISKWEDKLTEKENYYYQKFSAMETALSKLNSQSSSLSNLLS